MAVHSGENQTEYTGDQSVGDKGYDGSFEDKAILIGKAENRAHSDDVADGDHITHCGAYGLHGKNRSSIEAKCLGNRVLDAGEGQVRDGS